MDESTLLGEAPAFLALLDAVSAVAPLPRPVLIVGERGTGKELIAARLHYLSPRWDRAFVKVNCGALAPELLDSELFGHEAGAFTGALRRQIGRFERADGGTLFLDEIGNALPATQEKILRVIEYGEFERLGGGQSRRADVRVVAATNADLRAAAAAGRFRADLLDRLAFEVLTLPPLRARPDDIPLLADHFGRAMAHLAGRPFSGFSAAALDVLRRHPWPGNVRELKNAAERAVYRHDGEGPVTTVALDPFASPWTAPQGGEGGPPADLRAGLAAIERRWIEQALALAGQHQGRAAQALSLSYDQLRHLMRKHRLN